MTEKKITFEKLWIFLLAISSVFLGFLEFHSYFNEFYNKFFKEYNSNLQEDSLLQTFNH